MPARLRLLPLVMFSAALFLTVRIGGLWTGVDVAVGGTSVAETAPGKPIDLTTGMSAAGKSAPDKAAAEPAKDEAAKAGTAKGQPAKAGPEKQDLAKTEPAKPESTKPAAAPAEKPAVKPTEETKPAKPAAETTASEGAGESGSGRNAGDKAATDAKPSGDAAKGAPDKATGSATAQETPGRPVLPRKPVKDEAVADPDDMSRGDLKILQELAQRRRELDRREQDLQMRDGLLKAAEKRLDEKVAELTAMKAKLEALVKQHEDQQNVQLKSLVKIYETMKPKDAAQIFEELDMSILVELLAHMKEAKSAPIMAAMDPKRVKDVTARLINRRTLGPTAEIKDEKTKVR